MIKIFDKPGDGRTKIFITVEHGNVSTVNVGNQVVPTEQGFQFYVDDYVADQIEKCELYIDGFMPKLRLKDVEELEIPDEIEEKQREIEELERKLRELRGEEENELTKENEDETNNSAQK